MRKAMGTILIFVAIVLSIFLFIKTLQNIDMTEMRFFVTFWKEIFMAGFSFFFGMLLISE